MAVKVEIFFLGVFDTKMTAVRTVFVILVPADVESSREFGLFFPKNNAIA